MKKMVLVGLLVLLAGCKKSGNAEGTAVGGNQAGGGNAKVSENNPFQGGLAAAAAMGMPMKCTYTVDGVETEGWIKGKQFLGKMSGQEGVSNVIMKDACMWVWGEGQKQGMKMCFEEEEQGFWNDSEAADVPENLEALDMNYTCRPGVFGDEKFTPPAEVVFADFDDLMQGNIPKGFDMNAMQEGMQRNNQGLAI